MKAAPGHGFMRFTCNMSPSGHIARPDPHLHQSWRASSLSLHAAQETGLQLSLWL